MQASWVVVVGWVSKAVLVLLAGLSVWSFSVIYERLKAFRARDDRDQYEALKSKIAAANWADLKRDTAAQSGVRADVVRTLLDAQQNNAAGVEHAVRSRMTETRLQMDRGLGVLATLGSNAPFIGLFGTVLGIIQAFGALADKKGGDMNLVMFLVAEALIATAVGLFVAIPAVVAFNAFNRRLRGVMTDCEVLKELFLSRVARQG
ncbi:MAG: MotA/TolQ/ExbB proton channel family protein [Bdellovibrionales bacterium]|nr:MotA/TolQ/ExbB proton channel family protein [Bdellovibrionales bacterium]